MSVVQWADNHHIGDDGKPHFVACFKPLLSHMNGLPPLPVVPVSSAWMDTWHVCHRLAVVGHTNDDRCGCYRFRLRLFRPILVGLKDWSPHIRCVESPQQNGSISHPSIRGVKTTLSSYFPCSFSCLARLLHRMQTKVANKTPKWMTTEDLSKRPISQSVEHQ